MLKKGYIVDMNVLHLQENIENEKFRKLLDLCFQESVYFAFTRVRPDRHLSREEAIAYHNFLQKLNPYFVKSVTTTHWYGGYLPEKVNLFWYVCRTEPGAKAILNAYMTDLLLEERKVFPENLCFFTKDRLFLATVSHAEFCTAFPNSEEIAEQLMHLGRWGKAKLEIPWEELHLETAGHFPEFNEAFVEEGL